MYNIKELSSNLVEGPLHLHDKGQLAYTANFKFFTFVDFQDWKPSWPSCLHDKGQLAYTANFKFFTFVDFQDWKPVQAEIIIIISLTSSLKIISLGTVVNHTEHSTFHSTKGNVVHQSGLCRNSYLAGCNICLNCGRSITGRDYGRLVVWLHHLLLLLLPLYTYTLESITAYRTRTKKALCLHHSIATVYGLPTALTINILHFVSSTVYLWVASILKIACDYFPKEHW
jgi:hypothetical protein